MNGMKATQAMFMTTFVAASSTVPRRPTRSTNIVKPMHPSSDCTPLGAPKRNSRAINSRFGRHPLRVWYSSLNRLRSIKAISDGLAKLRAALE